jgi:SRSO17 transposase
MERASQDPSPVSVAEVNGWADGLEAVAVRIEPRFARAESRRRVRAYLRGLLSPLERKNGWQLAEHAGEATPDGMQHLLARAAWDADQVRDDLRAYVVEHLGDQQGVLVIDETGFLKKGTKSVGVQRQYSGTAGRIENCQIGVFLAYASPQGRTFLDRELYLPKEWAADDARRAEAAVPREVEFQTKPQLARVMLERAREASVPAAWVTGDEVYGGDRRLRVWLEERHLAHVLAIKRTEPLWSTHTWREVAAATLAAEVPAEQWERRSAGEGAKGPRVYDWTRVPIRPLREPGWEYWLLVRRSLSDPTDLAYYVCFSPQGTPLAELVRVAGTRWAIEEGFESTKGEVGLDQYEVRRWTGWYRHITLALLAHAYLTVTRAVAERGGVGLRTCCR